MTHQAAISVSDATVEATLAVAGMTCAACATRLEKALGHAPGVVTANVNFALERASVRFDPTQATPESLEAAVANAGFTGRVQTKPSAAPLMPPDRTGLSVVIAGLLTAPLVGQMISHMFGLGFHMTPWVEAALAAPVQFILGARFYRGAYAALKAGGANMDVLVALGTTSAFGFSVAVLLTNSPGDLYFEASAVVVTLVLFGKWLETRAKRATSGALRALMALRPATATVLRDGREVDIPIDDLRRGDSVMIRPGARIAVDAEIVSGESDIDESAITGESIPVLRTVGDPITAGALNGAGLLTARAVAVGNDTTLAGIIRLVDSAQAGKAPLQKLVDRVSAVFVPVVLVIAAATLIGWLIAGASLGAALAPAVAVLVIACPCALGLAMPTAIVAGVGAAARSGILFKDIAALEEGRKIDTIVFDKTGTLTEGKPAIVDLRADDGDNDTLLSLAASLQQASEHPLGRAIVAAAQARGLSLTPVTDFKSIAGRGAAGRVGAARVVVGNVALMTSEHVQIKVPKDLADQTLAYVAVDGRFFGVIALADVLRPNAVATIAALKTRGLRSVMLSGDALTVVARIAAQLGIDDARGALSPADKATAVAALHGEGRVVAMVGDGINDAPALAAADLGIAVGSGTDVARATAAVTLMRSDPALIPAVLDISAATWRIIRENLFWAFLYNVVGLPLAAAGLLNPMLAGAAMAASSVSVVLNALRLTRWRASPLSSKDWP